ncbi:hypothetical protein [Streptomyces lasiicapitis]|uniref:Uncharacterized protein n=1 Tax=Streptomyces lasiicapitis TaxID=1923961 RepID=A0ABQ2MWM5_9ACTN|nr:hypothetical protein [Streptomyces lasiicapitis]GGO59251.1 hypothetical protein GCM10012286_80420 [Streptomyces lasiicapitis]
MPPPSQPTDACRSRALVIDRAWRGLGPGLESLSGPGGAPLTRTVKLIVLPLIVRPSLCPELAADFLEPAQAARLDALVQESGARLRATAQWFTLLKKTRRALGIVAGHPQDLYFQRCFELATEYGAPSAGADAVARGVVEDVADAGGGRTVEALKGHLADGARRARLDEELAAEWADRHPVAADVGVAVALTGEVLEACGAARPVGNSPQYTAMVEAGHGGLFGRALWAHADEVWGVEELPAHLGLTARQAPPRPEVGRAASTALVSALRSTGYNEKGQLTLHSHQRRCRLERYGAGVTRVPRAAVGPV